MRKLDPRQLKVGDLIFQKFIWAEKPHCSRLVLSVEHNTLRGVADETTVTMVCWDLESEEKFDYVFAYEETDTWFVADDEDNEQ